MREVRSSKSVAMVLMRSEAGGEKFEVGRTRAVIWNWLSFRRALMMAVPTLPPGCYVFCWLGI